MKLAQKDERTLWDQPIGDDVRELVDECLAYMRMDRPVKSWGDLLLAIELFVTMVASGSDYPPLFKYAIAKSWMDWKLSEISGKYVLPTHGKERIPMPKGLSTRDAGIMADEVMDWIRRKAEVEDQQSSIDKKMDGQMIWMALEALRGGMTMAESDISALMLATDNALLVIRKIKDMPSTPSIVKGELKGL